MRQRVIPLISDASGGFPDTMVIVVASPWKFQLDLGGPDFIGTESGSQPPCPIGALQNMNPQEKSKKMDSTESGHPRLSLTAFFGEGRGGWGTNLEQSQIRQIILSTSVPPQEGYPLYKTIGFLEPNVPDFIQVIPRGMWLLFGSYEGIE